VQGTVLIQEVGSWGMDGCGGQVAVRGLLLLKKNARKCHSHPALSWVIGCACAVRHGVYVAGGVGVLLYVLYGPTPGSRRASLQSW
jgi:hypothetical protein